MRATHKVSDSFTDLICMISPQHLNVVGTLFGGQLAYWIDEVAGITAKRHCKGKVTTAAIDNLRFRGPATAMDVLVMQGRVTWVGNTSMEVRVDSYAEDINNRKRLINTAYVIMVAVDDRGRPVEVPDLELVTDEERAEFEAGAKRQELRKQINELERKAEH